MAKPWEQMSQEEKLTAIGAAANGGEVSPEAKQYIETARRAVSNKGWNMPIVRQPDPEADANHQINERLRQPAAAVIPQASNGVNPETGMPFFSKPAAPSPEDDERAQMNQFKMQYLKQKAQGQQ